MGKIEKNEQLKLQIFKIDEKMNVDELKKENIGFILVVIGNVVNNISFG